MALPNVKPQSPAAPVGETPTAESLGWQLRSALPPMRLNSVSICDAEADVLWLSEGALGPDEHSVVVEAIGALQADPSLPYFEFGMEDGRLAVFLAVRAPKGDLVGVAMILAEMKAMPDGVVERIVTPQVRTILQTHRGLPAQLEAFAGRRNGRDGCDAGRARHAGRYADPDDAQSRGAAAQRVGHATRRSRSTRS